MVSILYHTQVLQGELSILFNLLAGWSISIPFDLMRRKNTQKAASSPLCSLAFGIKCQLTIKPASFNESKLKYLEWRDCIWIVQEQPGLFHHEELPPLLHYHAEMEQAVLTKHVPFRVFSISTLGSMLPWVFLYSSWPEERWEEAFGFITNVKS